MFDLDEREKLYALYDTIDRISKENEQLHSIIKEVREYIKKTKFKYCDDELCYMIENHYNNILEILDKVEEAK